MSEMVLDGGPSMDLRAFGVGILILSGYPAVESDAGKSALIKIQLPRVMPPAIAKALVGLPLTVKRMTDACMAAATKTDRDSLAA